MATRTRNNELSEWPSILEGVEVLPAVKWPRRLAVPERRNPQRYWNILLHGVMTDRAYPVSTVDEANGLLLIERDLAYQGKVEHAGGGYVRITLKSTGATYRYHMKEILAWVRFEPLPEAKETPPQSSTAHA
jgi:hypothetical protein